jgi:hypothetical protein
MNAQQILIEAQRLLRDVGWCKGTYSFRDDEGRALAYCSIGAIIHTSEDYPNGYDDAIRAVVSLIDMPIAEWNDNPQLHKSTVLNIFSEAIASLEEKSQ